jgi:hypothetical protein
MDLLFSAAASVTVSAFLRINLRAAAGWLLRVAQPHFVGHHLSAKVPTALCGPFSIFSFLFSLFSPFATVHLPIAKVFVVSGLSCCPAFSATSFPSRASD